MVRHCKRCGAVEEKEMKIPGGIFGALTITFVVLKVLGYIDWSWWLVFLSLWGPIALTFAVLLSLIVFVVIWHISSLDDVKEWVSNHFYFKL